MKETDLDKVKAMAKVFLEIEIGETEMTPAMRCGSTFRKS